MTDFYERSLIIHEHLRGKLAVVGKLPIRNHDDLSTAYTPGVARPCQVIAADPKKARDLTIKHNSIAVVTDGSAVLGLGNIGALAAIPVMEGKALLFKQYGDLDAWPICLDTQDTDAIVAAVRAIAPVFGGINLEDISAPRCFDIEHRLQDLGIPVFHDDQHGTAIVVWAALINAGRVLGMELRDMHIVISGAGAAGTAIARLLRCADGYTGGQRRTGAKDIIVCDSKGAIHKGRDDLAPHKQSLLSVTNREDRRGSLKEVLEGADVFVGVSKPALLKAEDIARMGRRKIVLALANPEPEIMPGEAIEGGADIVCTGRSDFPNQVNNVLVFPGIFRGALDACAPRIDGRMKRAAAHALADAVRDPAPDHILPDALDRAVAPTVARADRNPRSEETLEC
ncbi:MAG: NADP-dependent malic enzyme [Candidatus Hydrogenedentes bacterium]|nr:NADP-dependent malic enzyme [Candidatus Hydrogenedentota bacterium]